ncbi:MAG: hypothetical protein R2756_04585 [Bacteroidales bacterium]
MLGKKIIIPPHFDVTGAIGAAILAQRSMTEGQKTTFKGFDIRNASYEITRFVCNGCVNHCEISSVKIEGEKNRCSMAADAKNGRLTAGRKRMIISPTSS